MAMFGSGLMQPRGPGTIPGDNPFGLPQFDTPDFGGPVSMPQPKKGGMFGAGKGNFGEIISAALNGFLAARGNPVGMAGLQMLHQRRNDAAAQQQAAQDRENQFQDFVRREAYKAANPDPSNPHRWESNDGSLMELGPDGPRVVYKDPTPRIQFVPNGLGGVIPINMSQFGAPTAPVGPLTPIDDDEGGPSLGGSGGFPRPY